MAPKRQALESALSTATAELLVEKGYICFVDVFMKLGYLSRADYENWRFGRVPCLERVLTLNLSAINFIMKTVRRNSLNGHLKPGLTVYKSWGKRKKTLLRFSSSGDAAIETAYATHFVKPKRTAHAKAQGDEETSTREGGPFETLSARKRDDFLFWGNSPDRLKSTRSPQVRTRSPEGLLFFAAF